MKTYPGEGRQEQQRGESLRTLQWELALTLAAIGVTLSAGALAMGDILVILADLVKTDHLARALAQALFLTIVGFLIYGACVYEFSRWGHLRRLLKHRPAREGQLARVWEEPFRPHLAILVPSYKEDVRVVRKTLLSAALQEYPNRRVVLLIDDPPHPVDLKDSRALMAARELPREVCSLLEEMRRRCGFALQRLRERCARGPLNLCEETSRLVQLYREVAAWFEEQANRYEVLDHADRLFVDITFLAAARRYQRQATELANGTGCTLRYPDGRGLLLAYERLLTRFQAQVTSFERKQYVNLSHEPNKAMNLNSYIGLMGKSFRAISSPQGLRLEPSGDNHADLTAPDADFVLMVDADSVLSPEYALRLIHLMRQPGNERVAVAQTPYSAFPGAPGVLERVAGATTDIQYCIHQGFTHFGATFWVGANAVVRKAALEDIAECDCERGYPITRFVQDRTVIEDTESSIDLADRDWSLLNYPERLAFSATPPDFGCLLIQRRRWANGGLIILQKLLRHVLRHPRRRGIVGEGLMRCHYLTSIAAVNFGLLLILGFSFEHSMRSSWLPFTAVPYYALYLRDLQRTGYRASDLLRVYALNLVLIPVNVGGVFRSLYQMWTGRKAAFGRTPKITGRTMAPPLYIVAEYAILIQWLLGAALDAAHGRAVHGVFATANAGFLAYGVSRFIGLRESWADLRRAWRQGPVRRPAMLGQGGVSPQRTHYYAGRPRSPQSLGVLFLALGLGCVLTPTPVAALTEMAVTVDDLPTHGALPRGASRLEIAQVMLRALQKHQVPEAYGFVNGRQVRASPEHLTVLQAWIHAGFPLANHTYSHLNLDTVAPGEYTDNIAEDARFLTRLREASTLRLFRYPYLAEGDILEKRDAVRGWLANQGYQIAQVTVYFDDWAWNEPYARCAAQHDLRSIDWLTQSFLGIAMRRLKWAEQVAQLVLDRPMKQILLLHAGAFDARMTDALLTAFERADVRFISLESALRDPVYEVNPNVTWSGEMTFLEQLTRAKHRPLPGAPGVSFRDLELICR